MGHSKIRRLARKLGRCRFQLEETKRHSLAVMRQAEERTIHRNALDASAGRPSSYPRKKFHFDGRTAVVHSMTEEATLYQSTAGTPMLAQRGWCDSQDDAVQMAVLIERLRWQ